jgi:hypothetical protein
MINKTLFNHMIHYYSHGKYFKLSQMQIMELFETIDDTVRLLHHYADGGIDADELGEFFEKWDGPIKPVPENPNAYKA